jgi:hypothetical protein
MELPFPVEFDGRVLDELFIEGQQATASSNGKEQSGEGGLAKRKLKKLLEI